MQNNCFVATVLRVEEGDTVTFHNKDEAVHSVTGVAWTWGDETPIAQGESVEHVFDENGVYVYTCLLHPGMAGAIIVGDGSGPGIGTTLVSGDTLQTSLGVGSPGVLPQGADPTSAAATSSGDGMDTLLVAGIVAAGVALLLALSGASMAMARASANRRAAR
jgi:hypothetical protein